MAEMDSDAAHAHILVVDDDRVASSVYRQTLEIRGFRVSSATDGRAALQMVRSERPDLIVLDLIMPVTDGWAVLAALKEMADPPPVVAVSASANGQDAVKAGAQAFFLKPCSLRDLGDACAALLRERRG
ncbi:MAG: response regulator [Acidobacteria bacterium]|nr:response regulator [Acidobacteriota bacterium]